MGCLDTFIFRSKVSNTKSFFNQEANFNQFYFLGRQKQKKSKSQNLQNGASKLKTEKTSIKFNVFECFLNLMAKKQDLETV